ncbi:MAG: hypothetical protein C0404_06525, partial [Verrucomicrobia bacterium]|nr:hypothetical protein [Verrucomicrobiota bacterium]
MKRIDCGWLMALGFACAIGGFAGEEFPKPYSAPCTEREDVFAFTEKPAVKIVAPDKYEITFAVKGNCDVTVGLVDGDGKVVRHLGSGVLGANAPAPFQRNSLKQTIPWDGKHDLGEYHSAPGKLKVRVQLGLKPEFDKALGGASPYRIPNNGRIHGLAVGADGVYVLSGSKGPCFYMRKFDRDGNYVRSLVPPPADLPEEKLQGMSYIEYEKGKKALHAVEVYESVAYMANYLNMPGRGAAGVQPVVIGRRFFYANPGLKAPSTLHYVFTDGSTDLKGIHGSLMLENKNKSHSLDFPAHPHPFLAASPDGKFVYMVASSGGDAKDTATEVWRKALDGDAAAGIFVGERNKPGSDEKHLNGAMGIACDPQGRVYVCDRMNNRVQIFTPEGKFLKTLPLDGPRLVAIHGKTGAVYVIHKIRAQGKSEEKLTVFGSFDDLREKASLEQTGAHLALDWHGENPRVWLAGDASVVGGFMSAWALEEMESAGGSSVKGDQGRRSMIRMWEESGGKFKQLADFDKRASDENGPDGVLDWNSGSLGYRVACDPLRETVYVSQSLKGMGLAVVFDLATGKPLHGSQQPGDDIIFDKRGYMHCHVPPIPQAGVVRLDVTQKRPSNIGTISGLPVFAYKETPYDYGEEVATMKGLVGVVKTKCQPGAKTFQDGIGVNMRGDLVVESNIYYVPKMEEEGRKLAWVGVDQGRASGRVVSGAAHIDYASYLKNIEEAEKRGDKIYSIKRQPGIPLAGATLWTYDRSGQLKQECAALLGDLANGAGIDEDGKLYSVAGRPRMLGERHFLSGQGGTFGEPGSKSSPFTGSLMKMTDSGVRTILRRSPVPLPEDGLPKRPPDLISIAFQEVFDKSMWTWVEGAEWIYAGASPIVASSCSCPKQNFYLDWYKRSFVPEQYRHSIGIVDTAGNLILHVGRY